MADTALIVIDIQNDYFPGGAMELVAPNEAAEQAAKLLAEFRRKALPVVHIQHVSTRAGATFLVPDTKGVEIHETVAPREGELLVQKHFPNSFRETRLDEKLRALGIERLAIAGMMTHMCIDATTRAAADLGYACLLAHDACATRNLAFGGTTVPAAQVQAAFVASLNGLFAKAMTVEEARAAI